MNVREWVNSATEAVRCRTPDVTPVTDVCRKGYTATVSSAAHAGGAATTKARELHEYLSDDQVHGNLTRVAKNLSFNGGLFLLRSYGGGPVIDIVSRSLRDGKDDLQRERLKDLETKVARLEEELSAKKIHEQPQLERAFSAHKSQDGPEFTASTHQRPEDVVRTFMTQHFIGTRLLDDLIIPGLGHRVKEKPVPNYSESQIERRIN